MSKRIEKYPKYKTIQKCKKISYIYLNKSKKEDLSLRTKQKFQKLPIKSKKRPKTRLKNTKKIQV